MLTSTHGWGGVESQTVALALALAERGHRVSIVQFGHRIYDSANIRPESEIATPYVFLPMAFDKLTLIRALHLVRPHKGDLCVFPKGHFGAGNWATDLAIRLCFDRYITVEHSLCEKMPNRTSRRHFGGMLPGVGLWWFRILLKRRLRSLAPSRIICVSEAIKKRLVEHAWFPSEKIVTIHNGIDPYLFRPQSEHRLRRRSAWGVPDDAFVFGVMGRFEEEKGYDLAVDLFGRLAAECPEKDLWLVLVGRGGMESELRRLANRTGRPGRIKFSAFTDRPWEVYPAFDALLAPSRIEGLGLAILESMACGCPAVAAKVGGIAEIIVNKNLGWLVESEDRANFLAAMREAAEMETDRLTEMGCRAREWVISAFNAEKQITALIDLIEKECSKTFFSGIIAWIKNLGLDLVLKHPPPV